MYEEYAILTTPTNSFIMVVYEKKNLCVKGLNLQIAYSKVMLKMYIYVNQLQLVGMRILISVELTIIKERY